jgi:acetoin utilization deacetylase AcuC-like enzyme
MWNHRYLKVFHGWTHFVSEVGKIQWCLCSGITVTTQNLSGWRKKESRKEEERRKVRKKKKERKKERKKAGRKEID